MEGYNGQKSLMTKSGSFQGPPKRLVACSGIDQVDVIQQTKQKFLSTQKKSLRTILIHNAIYKE